MRLYGPFRTIALKLALRLMAISKVLVQWCGADAEVKS
jgi:hypothetical protein